MQIILKSFVALCLAVYVQASAKGVTTLEESFKGNAEKLNKTIEADFYKMDVNHTGSITVGQLLMANGVRLSNITADAKPTVQSRITLQQYKDVRYNSSVTVRHPQSFGICREALWEPNMQCVTEDLDNAYTMGMEVCRAGTVEYQQLTICLAKVSKGDCDAINACFQTSMDAVAARFALFLPNNTSPAVEHQITNALENKRRRLKIRSLDKSVSTDSQSTLHKKKGWAIAAVVLSVVFVVFFTPMSLTGVFVKLAFGFVPLILSSIWMDEIRRQIQKNEHQPKA